MRILQLGPYPPPHGGVETNLVAIRRYLLRQGIPCAVINITRHRKSEGEEIYYPKSALGLLRLLLTLDYDVLHLHIGGLLTTRLLLLGLLCSALPGRKTVLTFHSGGYPTWPEAKTARPFSLRGIALRSFDCVIGVNRELIELFHSFGVSRDRARLIEPHAFSADPDIAPELPHELAAFVAAHRPVLVTVGALEPEYDIPLQVNALGAIRESHPDAGLVVAGGGREEELMRRTVAAKPYAEHVLLCGDVPHAVTLRLLADATLFLRTTHYDGDAISVREALRAGLPVIATDNGMRPDGVHLIPLADSAALIAAIRKCVALPRTPHAQDNPDERNLEAVLALYHELTGEKPRAAHP